MHFCTLLFYPMWVNINHQDFLNLYKTLTFTFVSELNKARALKPAETDKSPNTDLCGSSPDSLEQKPNLGITTSKETRSLATLGHSEFYTLGKFSWKQSKPSPGQKGAWRCEGSAQWRWRRPPTRGQLVMKQKWTQGHRTRPQSTWRWLFPASAHQRCPHSRACSCSLTRAGAPGPSQRRDGVRGLRQEVLCCPIHLGHLFALNTRESKRIPLNFVQANSSAHSTTQCL